jgi:hypothetical protein
VTDLLPEKEPKAPQLAENETTKAKLRKNLSHQTMLNQNMSLAEPKIKRVGHYAVMTDKLLGKGHYGEVFMAYEIKGDTSSFELIKE